MQEWQKHREGALPTISLPYRSYFRRKIRLWTPTDISLPDAREIERQSPRRIWPKMLHGHQARNGSDFDPFCSSFVFCGGSSTRWRACHAKTGPACGTVLVPADGNLFWSRIYYSVLKLRHAFFTRSPGHPSKNRHISRLCSTGANGALTHLSSSRKRFDSSTSPIARKVDEPCPPPEAWLRRKSCIFCRSSRSP